MEVKNVDIDSIKPYKNNPRNNDDAVEATANSIKEFGWQQPIVVDNDGVIIVGHTRLKAAKKLGLKQVPIVVAENLTDEQANAYRLADNKTGELADWDFDLLDDELSDIPNIDMNQFGFDEPEDVDIDELTFDPGETTGNKEYLSWGDTKIEINENDIAKLDRIYKKYDDSKKETSFVDYLVKITRL